MKVVGGQIGEMVRGVIESGRVKKVLKGLKKDLLEDCTMHLYF